MGGNSWIVAFGVGVPFWTDSRLSSGRSSPLRDVSRNNGGTLSAGKVLQPPTNNSPEQTFTSLGSAQGRGYSIFCFSGFFLPVTPSSISLNAYPPTAGPALDE